MMGQRSLRCTSFAWSRVTSTARLNPREMHSRDSAKLRQLSRRVRVLEQRLDALLSNRTKCLDQSESPDVRRSAPCPGPHRRGSRQLSSSLPPPPSGFYPPVPSTFIVGAPLLSLLLTAAVWVIVGPVFTFILLPFGLFAALTIFL